MEAKVNILQAVKIIGGIVLSLGVAMFVFGFFANGFSILTPIGIGTMMGAVFIFLMGIFFVATEEMLQKRYKGIKVVTPVKLSSVK
ncbi:hypothetical protein ACJ2A9_22850 [Anaerobacillus sp. MEB173]|uniref:hypothetical protein n=1 Tax=Anaerobacillus sp. MEB173 TaxID=3383345 RepID=UPI003F8EEE75